MGTRLISGLLIYSEPYVVQPMNLGLVGMGLGVLGLVVGAGMYAADWHRTIGLGGIVLGVILLVGGFWLWRSAKPKVQTQPVQPTQPAATP